MLTEYSIRFHIRCWIVCLAVKDLGVTPRKKKGKGKSNVTDICGGEHSDDSGSADVPQNALENPKGAAQHAEPRHQGTIAPSRANHPNANMETETESPSKRMSPWSPNKRKAQNSDAHNLTSKLKKVSKDAQPKSNSFRIPQRDLYSVPRSPTLPLQATHLAHRFGVHRHRESTQDTDATYMPQTRDMTVDTDTVVDGDELAADAIGRIPASKRVSIDLSADINTFRLAYTPISTNRRRYAI